MNYYNTARGRRDREQQSLEDLIDELERELELSRVLSEQVTQSRQHPGLAEVTVGGPVLSDPRESGVWVGGLVGPAWEPPEPRYRSLPEVASAGLSETHKDVLLGLVCGAVVGGIATLVYAILVLTH